VYTAAQSPQLPHSWAIRWCIKDARPVENPKK